MRMKIIILAALLPALTASAMFAQADDGTLGATSSASADVTIDITDNSPVSQVNLTGLEDISFSRPADPAITIVRESISNICVFASLATTYSMEIVSVNSNINERGRFEGSNVTYAWRYNDGHGHGFSGARIGTGLTASSTADCASGLAGLELTMNTVDINNSSGTLTDVLELTVTPE